MEHRIFENILAASPEKKLVERYLQISEQTELSAKSTRLVEQINGDFNEKIASIFELISVLKNRGFKKELFRKRTAEQIINDGFITGCTDAALVYLALARKVGLASKYVETIDKKWLQGGGDEISGHVYVQTYSNKKQEWTWIDPMNRKSDDVSLEKDERVIYKEGLDSWDIGITDFESLKSAFNKIRTDFVG